MCDIVIESYEKMVVFLLASFIGIYVPNRSVWSYERRGGERIL